MVELAAHPDRDVELRRDAAPGDSDLPGVRHPPDVGDLAGGGEFGAQYASQWIQLHVLVRRHSTADSDHPARRAELIHLVFDDGGHDSSARVADDRHHLAAATNPLPRGADRPMTPGRTVTNWVGEDERIAAMTLPPNAGFQATSRSPSTLNSTASPTSPAPRRAATRDGDFATPHGARAQHRPRLGLSDPAAPAHWPRQLRCGRPRSTTSSSAPRCASSSSSGGDSSCDPRTATATTVPPRSWASLAAAPSSSQATRGRPGSTSTAIKAFAPRPVVGKPDLPSRVDPSRPQHACFRQHPDGVPHLVAGRAFEAYPGATVVEHPKIADSRRAAGLPPGTGAEVGG